MPLTPEPLVQIKENGTVKGAASSLNFTGAGVTAAVAGRAATIAIPGGGGGALSNAAMLTAAAGQFEVPANVTLLFVELVAAGGAGGVNGVGGGPGGYAAGFFAVTPGQMIDYEVGGTTWFSNDSELFADVGHSGDDAAGEGLAGGYGGSENVWDPPVAEDYFSGFGSCPVPTGVGTWVGGDGGPSRLGPGGSAQSDLIPGRDPRFLDGTAGGGGAGRSVGVGTFGPGAGGSGLIVVWY